MILLCGYIHLLAQISSLKIMASLFGGLLKRVVRVRIEGNINQAMTDKIALGMKTANFVQPEAVVVTINSPGGSLAQAKHINDMLRNYAVSKNAPIYCFAEDQCLGSATAILTSGVKAYANPMSFIGDFGYSWSTLWFKKFADKYNVKQEFIYSGENKVKFNIFEDIKPQSQKWMQNYLYLLEHELKTVIINQRQKHFAKRNYEKEQLENEIFAHPILQPEAAVKTGLVDELLNLDELLNSTFSGTKVLEVNKRQQFDKYKMGMQALGWSE